MTDDGSHGHPPSEAAGTADVRVLHKPLLFVSLPMVFISFALPIYAKGMGASALAIGGLFAVFTAALMILRPLVGIGLDRFGRKVFLIFALVVYAAANLVFCTATDLDILFAARFLQGLGASLLLITVDTITVDLTTASTRASALGANTEKQARGGMYGAFIGFTLLGAMGTDKGWTVAFAMFAVAAAVGLWYAVKDVPETRPAKPHRTPFSFRGLEIRPELVRLMLVVFTAGFASALIQPIYLIYLQDKFTVHIGQLALAFLPAGIVYMTLPSKLGGLSDRFGRIPVLAGGLAISGFLYGFFPFLPSLLWLAVGYTLSAVGSAMADPVRTAMVGDLSREEERGRILGLYQLITGVGATLGPLVGGWLYDHHGHDIPFFLNGILLLISAIWVVLLLKDSRAMTSETT